jgi:hypothetical protein
MVEKVTGKPQKVKDNKENLKNQKTCMQKNKATTTVI